MKKITLFVDDNTQALIISAVGNIKRANQTELHALTETINVQDVKDLTRCIKFSV